MRCVAVNSFFMWMDEVYSCRLFGAYEVLLNIILSKVFKPYLSCSVLTFRLRLRGCSMR